jgi:hypothetical protein
MSHEERARAARMVIGVAIGEQTDDRHSRWGR